LCHLQHKLIGFYNRDEKCLQRGTDWVFKYSSLRFDCKGLIGFRLFHRNFNLRIIYLRIGSVPHKIKSLLSVLFRKILCLFLNSYETEIHSYLRKADFLLTLMRIARPYYCAVNR